MSKVIVKMLRPFMGINPGETAAWDADEAAMLVKQSAAEIIGAPEDDKVKTEVEAAKRVKAKK